MSSTHRWTFLELEDQSRSRRKLAKHVARKILIADSSRSGRKTCRRTMDAHCLEMTLSLGTSKRQRTTFQGQQNVQVNQASSSKDPTRGAHTALLLILVNLVKVTATATRSAREA